MSDFYEERPDRDHDDWREQDQAEHEHRDAAHERFLDDRDRDLPAPGFSTGLCAGCRGNAALPDGSLCGDCLAEVLVA